VCAHEVLKVLVESSPAVMGGSGDVGSSCGGHFPQVQGMFLPPSFASKYAGAATPSGQDVALAMKAKEILLQLSKSYNDKMSAVDGTRHFPAALVKVQVVSMPCWELFDEQDQEYQDSVLLSNHKEVFRAYVEKAATRNTGHQKYADMAILMESFGMSGKAVDVEEKMQFTPQHVAAKVWGSWLSRCRALQQEKEQQDPGVTELLRGG